MDRISSTTLKYNIQSTSTTTGRVKRRQPFVFLILALCSNTCESFQQYISQDNDNNNNNENDMHYYNLATTTTTGIRNNRFFDDTKDSLKEIGSTSLTRSNNNQQQQLLLRRRQTFEVENNENNHVVVNEALEEEPLRFAFLDNELLDPNDELATTKEHNNDSRIIDGNEIPNDRYLYLVALFKKDTKGYLTHMCGGAIISPNYVLTAAHCLANTNVVVTGLKDYRKVMPGTYERYDVTQDDFIPHPEYSSSTLHCDFALIKLSQRTRFPRLQLNFNDFIPQGKQIMTVMGWGYLRNNNASSIANEAVLENVDMMTCRAKWGVSTIKDSMMCATGYGKVDTCQGDSGGPMIIKGLSDQQDRLIGLTSWGAGCADATYPGVYARVSYTKEWIQSMIPELFDSNGNPIVPQEETSTASTNNNNNSGGTTTTTTTDSTSNTSPGSSGTTTSTDSTTTTSTPPAESGCVIETQCVTILFVYNWCHDVCV